ncbi:MAG: nucleotidyl transferase AbiEii/AbiGii toxin family protein [Gammaproteobacteria bacterium]|nr:nucleotidyl transferase AbiEii/AbiGii toxin family protein [Gammaproteobacteria bacterium]
MSLKPTRLPIQPGPAKAVRTVMDVLSRWIDTKHLRLGDGTALEARWHHRSSTDFDFFALSEHADVVFYERFDHVLADLELLARDGVVPTEGMRMTGRTIVHFRVGETPVSFGRVDIFHGDPADEVEYASGVVLSGTRDILAKKMYNRLGSNRLATERDAYDFAVARTKAPDDLTYAWGLMPEYMKEIAAGLCRERAERGSPLELDEARYAPIARDVWGHVVRMFESDLEYVPPLDEGGAGHG